MWVVVSNIVIGLYLLYYLGLCDRTQCGQYCVFRILVVGSNIVMGLYGTCGQYNRVLGSNIVIGLYIQGMWSVLCVPYVGGGI